MELVAGVGLVALCSCVLIWQARSASSKVVRDASPKTLKSPPTLTQPGVPVLGSTAFFGYPTAFNALTSFRQMMIEGHAKFKGKPFQMPALRSWIIYVSRDLYEDLRKARDESLSSFEETNEFVAFEYTFGKALATNMWHNAVVRKQMTSNLGAIFPDVYDEISQAFEDELQLSANGDWNAVCAYEVIMYVVCRASNRLFVGLPLCRNKEYTQISRDFTMTVINAGFLISCFPKFLRPLVGRYLSSAPAAIRGFEKYIIPMIEERRRREVELGEVVWAEKKPFDFLQWMMDAAIDEQRDSKDLNLRMLLMNFAATHTSTLTFTHAFYWLAASPPAVAAALGAEVDGALKAHGGWTKGALNAMVKIDSFLKESMRHPGLGGAGMWRKAMRSVVLSDGTLVPAGAHIALNTWSVYHDPEIYEQPDEFDPWRFSRKIEEGDSAVRHAFTTASSEFFLWGGGAPVCGGRFFASQELKAMLAHIVHTYDISLPGEGARPVDTWFGASCVPNRKALVMFRRRSGTTGEGKSLSADAGEE